MSNNLHALSKFIIDAKKQNPKNYNSEEECVPKVMIVVTDQFTVRRMSPDNDEDAVDALSTYSGVGSPKLKLWKLFSNSAEAAIFAASLLGLKSPQSVMNDKTAQPTPTNQMPPADNRKTNSSSGLSLKASVGSEE